MAIQTLLLKGINRYISQADAKAAAAYVASLKADQPEAKDEELVDQLIRRKCRQAGSVGAVTSGAAIIPGLGTVAAMTFGVAADIGMTFKLQAELVLEIAAVYGRELSENEKQKIILSITGVSAGSQAALQKAGQQIAAKTTAQLAQKSLAKAIPFLGVAASGGTNMVTTYIIGRRAQAYFSLGPDEMEGWADGLRAISGVNEQEIIGWLGETTESSWQMISDGTRSTKDSIVLTSKNSSTAIVVYSKKAAGAISSAGGQLLGAISDTTNGAWQIISRPFRKDDASEKESLEAVDSIDLVQFAEQLTEANFEDQQVIGVVGAGDDIEPESTGLLATITSFWSKKS